MVVNGSNDVPLEEPAAGKSGSSPTNQTPSVGEPNTVFSIEAFAAKYGLNVGTPAKLCVIACVAIVCGFFLFTHVQPGTENGGALQPLTTAEFQAVKDLASTQLEDKPKSDKRIYQHATLPNGLKVLNIQDEKATQAAISVAVDAGSLDNPEKLPGLAHFCEHMLFLGTKKYPEADGFENFISQAGGYNNAFTADEHTVYFTEVSAHAAEESIARFADFFRDPLFNEQYVNKEVNAIESEHAKNVQDQNRRIFETFSAIANPENPMSRFKTGNVETLITEPKKIGLNPVDELKTWFKDHYCPSKMRLVTFGPDSVQKQLARSSQQFSDIGTGNEKCQAERRSWASPEPWPATRLGKMMVMEGSKPQPELWIHFPLPDIRKEYKSTPLTYINYVVTYGGEQSLSRVLQDKLGLVNSFGLTGSGGSTGYDMFIVASLTKAGHDNYETVLDVFFQYMATLQKQGVDMELYKSLADVTKLEWDWSEPSSPADTASGMAEQMINTPMEDLLSAGSRIDNPNATLVADLLSRIRPGNMNVGVVEPNKNSALFKNMEEKVLAHYNAKYALTDLKKKLPGAIERWNSYFNSTQALGDNKADPGVTQLVKVLGKAKLATDNVIATPPKAIEGVPKDVNVDNMRASTENTEGAGVINQLFGERPNPLDASAPTDANATLVPKLWYRRGWVTESPKMSMHMEFVIPRKADSWEEKPDDALRLSIYSSLLGEEMNPKMYDLSMTGISYGLNYGTHSISFSFSGFAPLMPELMDRVLSEFDRGVNVSDPSRYNRIVTEMEQSLQTFSDMPITYAIQDRNFLLTPGSSSRDEQLAALKRMTPKSVASAPSELVLPKAMQLTGLAVGNIADAEAQKSFEKIQTRASSWAGSKAKPAEGEEIRRFVPVVKPSKPVELRRLNQRPGDPNDAFVMSVLVGVSTVESRVVLGLLSTILHNVAYSELRTERMLGYVVNAGISPLSNVQYVSCVVQGERLKADDLEGAVEYVYLDLMPRTLKNMTDDEFASHKQSLTQQLMTPPSTFDEEFNHFWSPIAEGGNCFNLQDEMLKYLQSEVTSKDMLVQAWNKIMFPAEGARAKLIVKHFAKEVPARPSLEEIRKIWKKQGVNETNFKMLETERGSTMVFTKLDSGVREDIVKSGTYYPTDLHCTRAVPQGEASNATSGKQQAASMMEMTEHTDTRRAGSKSMRGADDGATFLGPDQDAE